MRWWTSTAPTGRSARSCALDSARSPRRSGRASSTDQRRTAPAGASLGAAAHRRQQLDGAHVCERGLGRQEARVLAIDEHGDEAAERAVAQHARREVGIALGEDARERREVVRLDRNGLLAADRGTQRRGKTDERAHESTSAYAAWNASASGAMTSPSASSAGSCL